MNMHEQHSANINPNKLKVDFSYQRQAHPAKVNEIVKNFSMDIFNQPKVSHRSDGYYYIFDGQHSMLAHKIVFGNNAPINCRVYEGLSYDEEVELFIQQNGISTKVSSKDELRAESQKEDSDVKKMIQAAAIAGVKIDFMNGTYANHISAVTAAYYIWQLLGKDDFINVLSVIKASWDGDSESFAQGFLKGIAYIYKHYGSQIKNSDLIDSFKRNTPVFYARKAKDLRGSLMKKYATVFIEAYNYKKKYRLEAPIIK